MGSDRQRGTRSNDEDRMALGEEHQNQPPPQSVGLQDFSYSFPNPWSPHTGESHRESFASKSSRRGNLKDPLSNSVYGRTRLGKSQHKDGGGSDSSYSNATSESECTASRASTAQDRPLRTLGRRNARRSLTAETRSDRSWISQGKHIWHQLLLYIRLGFGMRSRRRSRDEEDCEDPRVLRSPPRPFETTNPAVVPGCPCLQLFKLFFRFLHVVASLSAFGLFWLILNAAHLYRCLWASFSERFSRHSSSTKAADSSDLAVSSSRGVGNQDLPVLTIRALLYGLPRCGRTALLYRLKLKQFIPTIPTVEAYDEEFLVTAGPNGEMVRLKVWDVGRCDSIIPTWRQYHKRSDCVIFVVDSNNRRSVAAARDELFELLFEDHFQQSRCRFLVFAHKQDVNNSLSRMEIENLLGLPKEMRQRWKVVGSSAVTGQGLLEGIRWLSSTSPEGQHLHDWHLPVYNGLDGSRDRHASPSHTIEFQAMDSASCSGSNPTESSDGDDNEADLERPIQLVIAPSHLVPPKRPTGDETTGRASNASPTPQPPLPLLGVRVDGFENFGLFHPSTTNVPTTSRQNWFNDDTPNDVQ